MTIYSYTQYLYWLKLLNFHVSETNVTEWCSVFTFSGMNESAQTYLTVLAFSASCVVAACCKDFPVAKHLYSILIVHIWHFEEEMYRHISNMKFNIPKKWSVCKPQMIPWSMN